MDIIVKELIIYILKIKKIENKSNYEKYKYVIVYRFFIFYFI